MKKIVVLLVVGCCLMACHRPMRVVESKSEIILIDSKGNIHMLQGLGSYKLFSRYPFG